MSNASNFIIENGVLIKYNGQSKTVTIPEGVTAIGDSAFSQCSSLQAVTIPESVTSIGDGAFIHCSRLQSVNIPESVTSIGNNAFYGCTGLADADGLVIVRNVLYGYCGSPAFMNIQFGIIFLSDSAFLKYSSLQSVTIPEGVTSIGDGAFSGCSSLQSVNIPESVASIGSRAFYKCSSLQSVTIPEGVTFIGDEAFFHCSSLQSVNIPESVTSIGNNAFYGCTGLADADGFVIIRNVLYRYCGSAAFVNIPNGVICISGGAFFGCSSLQSVTIPESVTAIGSCAFFRRDSLQSVTIPGSVTSIGGSAFYGCKSLQSVTIPESVTSIGDWAFCDCSGITKLTIPVHLGSAVTKVLEYGDDLRICIPDLSVLPEKFQLCAALCFADDGGPREDPRFKSHSKYLKAYAGTLANIAVSNLDLLALLCREKWIQVKDSEQFLTVAQQSGSAEAITMLLDYHANRLTDKDRKRAARQEDILRERAVARANRDGIAGLNFAISGTTTTFKNRKEVKAFLESKGAKLQSSLSAKTDYLIMNSTDASTDQKYKAEELGIEIIKEWQFNDLAGRQSVPDFKDIPFQYRVEKEDLFSGLKAALAAEKFYK